MQGAVKLTPSQSLKTNGAGSLSSLKVSEKTDDFIKLLQTKKETPTDSGGTKKTEASKTSEKTPKAETAEKKPEVAQENSEEEVSSREALQQAALQQTAAMMAGILPQTEETVQAPVEEILPQQAVDGIQGDGMFAPEPVMEEAALPMEEMAEPAVEIQAAVAETSVNLRNEAVSEKASQPKAEPEAVKEAVPQAANPVTEKEAPQENQSASDSSSREREDLAGSQSQQTSRQQEVSGESQAAAGAQSMRLFGQQGQEGFAAQRTEIPLKTTPETLPQDLGKTLEGNLLKQGQTLTVELEPASLGKLTIRLVYEGDRAAVSIMANNPRTLELLNQKASEIASILEEKTGQETLIYTQQPQQNQEGYDREPDGKQQREEGKEQHQKQDEPQQTDSFAQQLRLGLI